jgi:hypothetical protein
VNLVVVVVVLVEHDVVFVVVVVVLVTILELWVHLPIPQVMCPSARCHLVHQNCVLLCPDQPLDPQNNTNSDAHHVDSDQARTINFTDDGHVEVDRGQAISFVEDALPSTSTLSPDCRMAPRTFLSYPDFCYSCAVLADLDASSYAFFNLSFMVSTGQL